MMQKFPMFKLGGTRSDTSMFPEVDSTWKVCEKLYFSKINSLFMIIHGFYIYFIFFIISIHKLISTLGRLKVDEY